MKIELYWIDFVMVGIMYCCYGGMLFLVLKGFKIMFTAVDKDTKRVYKN